jgi:cobalt/nickel transport system permease protein
MIGNLFLRGYARSERVYQAMLARGYQGEIKQLTPHRITGSDMLAGALPLLSGLVILLASLILR